MCEKAKLLDDFEHGDERKYGINNHFVKSYQLSLSNEKAKYGRSSLKVEYDFSGWKHGNGAMYILFNEKLITKRLPKKLSMWIFGDGKSPWLRATIFDGAGEKKTVNLTENNIDWIGWRYIDVPIDSSWQLPIRLHQIYAVETDKRYQGCGDYKGSFYIDYLRFVYIDNEDWSGPVFSELRPTTDTVFNNKFLFSVKITDEKSGVNPSSIIMKVNNNKVNHHYYAKTGCITYWFCNKREGTYKIEVSARDYAGNASLPSINKKLRIDLSPDSDPPLLYSLTPTNGTIYYTSTPRITFQLIDEKRGIDKKDIKVSIDHTTLSVIYDEKTGWCAAFAKKPIPEGQHTVTIMAKDRCGNKTAPIRRTFFVQDLTKNWQKTNIRIPIIPDTHSSASLRKILQVMDREKLKNAIHMGDIVDQAFESEFTEINANINMFANQAVLRIPGNHEAFQNNLNLFRKYGGVASFHIIYEDLLIVFLNSAFDQSISYSDSTQFTYLKILLTMSKWGKIIIITHVPTRDDFGTSHQMVDHDAKMLEKILSDYKAINSTIDIKVLFGHLHVLQKWERGGITYIITGNGASKGYVSNDQGNIFGYGVLALSQNKIDYLYYPLLTKLYLHIDGKETKNICLSKSKTKSICLVGHFNELNENKHIDLTHFYLIDQKWSTSNKDIVSIRLGGKIMTHQTGNAIVEVEVTGIKARLNITVY
jgi:predicted phosphodiesterase